MAKNRVNAPLPDPTLTAAFNSHLRFLVFSTPHNRKRYTQLASEVRGEVDKAKVRHEVEELVYREDQVRTEEQKSPNNSGDAG